MASSKILAEMAEKPTHQCNADESEEQRIEEVPKLERRVELSATSAKILEEAVKVRPAAHGLLGERASYGTDLGVGPELEERPAPAGRD